MRKRRLDHLDGDDMVDMLRSADLDARFYAARKMRDLHTARAGAYVLTARARPGRPRFKAKVFRLYQGAHRSLHVNLQNSYRPMQLSCQHTA